MDAMVSDLLTVARLDAGKLAINREAFDLAAVILDAAERFERRAASEEVRLEVRAPEELRARGDPQRTGQILGILLDNAIAHTPRGGRVTLTARTLDGAEAVVRDTGPGIPSEHLPRVFERFYRVNDERPQDVNGLGLSIAAAIAEAHGGSIQAHSRVGEGTRMTLHLPLLEPPAAGPAAPPLPARQAGPSRAR